jgi:Rrf2 family iron-sulfur cluster assembly transcriptional regulator
MRFSTKSRYAIRAMIDLAIHEEEDTVPRADIAWRQAISADYLAQLFRGLQRMGLVEGVKGPGGGYRLSHTPSDISAADIIRAVEGPIVAVDCQSIHDGLTEDQLSKCPAHWLWNQVTKAIIDVLTGITLEDLTSRTADCADWFVHECPSVGVLENQTEV